MNAPVIKPAFAHLIPAKPIADLAADHAAHTARIAAIDAQFDAWSTRLDAALKQWEACRG